MTGSDQNRRRGGPLLLIAVVAFLWIGGRTVLWESPFAANPPVLPSVGDLIAKNEATARGAPKAPATPGPQASADNQGAVSLPGYDFEFERRRFVQGNRQPLNRLRPVTGMGGYGGSAVNNLSHTTLRDYPSVAMGHQALWSTAMSYRAMPRRSEAAFAGQTWPPFTARPLSSSPASPSTPGRFSVDAWAFWRDGSNATAISQGRVPIYGASQIGANFQFKLDPTSRRDPRLYFRAYRALVSNGETEVALGGSIRPVAAVPLRAHAEARYTDGTFFNEARAAAFLVTELPPQDLPGGFVAEAYGQAGYVTGRANTAFADGQVTITRELATFDLKQAQPARLSVGAGAWGGAQRDATRLDLGPSVRLDLTIGEVPARVSVDWREQVAGDAAPGSGVAATLSTRF